MRLLKKGAEAYLLLGEWYGRKVIVKKRVAKRYRVKKLCEEIRRSRTLREASLLHDAKLCGVPTPVVYLVDPKRYMIVMEYVEGVLLKELLDGLSPQERSEICTLMGEHIGKLHRAGIIHGDLTTSNMILARDDRVFFIDFGLGEYSSDLEDRGVDLHLMERALQSTHFRYARECFESVLEGYASMLGSESAREVLAKVREIERRGRYVER